MWPFDMNNIILPVDPGEGADTLIENASLIAKIIVKCY